MARCWTGDRKYARVPRSKGRDRLVAALVAGECPGAAGLDRMAAGRLPGNGVGGTFAMPARRLRRDPRYRRVTRYLARRLRPGTDDRKLSPGSLRRRGGRD